MACHNRKAKTLACLDALFKNTLSEGYSLDVFLVDDGSTDGTAIAVKEKHPQVNIITGNGQLFWNRGMHLAWQSASQANNYDFYLWLNDDTDIFPHSLSTMLAAAETTGNRAVIVAPICSKITGKLTYSGYQSNGDFSADVRVEPTNHLVPITYFCGNCVLVPRPVWEKVGPLDPLFHHSLGDFDYGFRVSKAGFKSFLAPEYLAYCEQHDTLPKWCLTSVPMKQRWATLYSPLGHCHPYYFFRYELRHFGLMVALRHFLSVNFRMLMPQLWEK
jgi:GT2 family glycosyltransferase